MKTFRSTLERVRLPPNGTNLGLFQIRFQYILARRAKMYCNLIWKSPRFVPFGANLTHFGSKSGHPGLCCDCAVWLWWVVWVINRPQSTCFLLTCRVFTQTADKCLRRSQSIPPEPEPGESRGKQLPAAATWHNVTPRDTAWLHVTVITWVQQAQTYCGQCN